MPMQTCMGAKMKCSFGVAPSTLIPTPKTVQTNYVQRSFFGSTAGDSSPRGFSGGFQGEIFPWAGTNSPVAPLFFAANVTGTSSSAQGPVIGIGGDFATTQFKVNGQAQVLAGWQFQVAPRVFISPLLGVSAINGRGTAISNEIPGGGNANSFTQNKTFFGPTGGFKIATDITPRAQVFFMYSYTWFSGTVSPGGTSSLGSVTTSNINVGGSSSAYLGLSFAFGAPPPPP